MTQPQRVSSPLAARHRAGGASPFEKLEQRRLMTTVQLDFTGDAGGLVDNAGVGTGFTHTQTNANAGSTASGSSYDASLLEVDNGLLRIQSVAGNDGTNSGATNNLVNALQLRHDATSAFVVQTRIVGENNAALTQFDARFEQAGLILGGDADNWVKLVAIHHNDGPAIQFTDEWSSGGSVSSTIGDGLVSVGSWAGVTSLDLRIEGNPADGTLVAQYRINDGIWMTVPHTITVPAANQAAFFDDDAAAGLTTFHRNTDAGRGVTTAFESFSIVPVSNGVNENSPSVIEVRPGENADDVRRDVFVAVDIALPGGAIDPSTATPTAIYLIDDATGQAVPAAVTVSGGGDAITLTPKLLLAAEQSYTFVITSEVLDVAGNAFVPFTAGFTTGIKVAESLPEVA
ncbi:MAG: Ig-like domain-containing protein, partial [Planctomycetota bacterium]